MDVITLNSVYFYTTQDVRFIAARIDEGYEPMMKVVSAGDGLILYVSCNLMKHRKKHGIGSNTFQAAMNIDQAKKLYEMIDANPNPNEFEECSELAAGLKKKVKRIECFGFTSANSTAEVGGFGLQKDVQSICKFDVALMEPLGACKQMCELEIWLAFQFDNDVEFSFDEGRHSNRHHYIIQLNISIRYIQLYTKRPAFRLMPKSSNQQNALQNYDQDLKQPMRYTPILKVTRQAGRRLAASKRLLQIEARTSQLCQHRLTRDALNYPRDAALRTLGSMT